MRMPGGGAFPAASGNVFQAIFSRLEREDMDWGIVRNSRARSDARVELAGDA